MPGELRGNVIVLTGGAEGIGFECASSYVREGASEAVVDCDGEKAAKAVAELGTDCIAVKADVEEGPAVEAAIHSVLAHYGKIDAVHNNAGIARPSETLDQSTDR